MPNGLPSDVRPHLGDQDVGRGAHQRHEAAQHGGERHRHQQRGRRRLVAPASCSATGMKIASAPTFLVTIDSSMQRRRPAPAPAIAVVRSFGAIGRIAASTTPERAIAGADHQRGGDDHHHLVGEPLEGMLRRHDPDHHAGRQRRQRHQVIGQPAPSERSDRWRRAAGRPGSGLWSWRGGVLCSGTGMCNRNRRRSSTCRAMLLERPGSLPSASRLERCR